MKRPKAHRTLLARIASRAGRTRSAQNSAGQTMLETLACVAIIAILSAMVLPGIAKTWQSSHLSSATSDIASAVQSVRYQSIFYGCSYQMVISGTSYQVSGQLLSGTPPICSTTYSNVIPGNPPTVCTGACTIPFSQGDVSVNSPVTLTFNPNGTVSTAGTSSAGLAITNIVVGFAVPGQTATRTISVSGTGYVTIT